MKICRSRAIALLLPVLFLLVIPVFGGDIFLEVPDVPGESLAVGFQDQIDLLSGSFAAANPACTGVDGSPAVSEFVFTKEVDLATAKLFENLAIRKVSATATVRFTATYVDLGRQVYLSYEFTNVLFTSGSSVGLAGDNPPQESWSMSFSSVKITYTPYSNTGAAQPPVVTTIVPAGCGGS